jgi:hypothetical protein
MLVWTLGTLLFLAFTYLGCFLVIRTGICCIAGYIRSMLCFTVGCLLGI